MEEHLKGCQMIRRLKRLLKEIGKRGVFGGIKWMTIEIERKIFPHRQVIWLVDLMEICDEKFALPDDIKIKRYNGEDEIEHGDYIRLVETGTELMGSNAKNIIKKYFNKGAQLWLMKKNGQLAGYKWSIVKEPLLPTYIPHTEKDVHGMAGEMFEEFRGKGLFQIFTNYQLIALKKDGFSRLYSESYVWDKLAVRALSKIYRKIGEATIFRIRGKKIVIWHEMLNED
jgi:hypothetical protein